MPQDWQIVNGRFDPYATRQNQTSANDIASLQKEVDRLTNLSNFGAPPPQTPYTPSSQWQSQMDALRNSQGGGLFGGVGQPQGGNFGQFGQPRQAPSLGLFNVQPINAQALSAKYLGKGTS